MANNPPKKTASLSKKHLDRLHREKQQIKWITIGAIVVILLVTVIQFRISKALVFYQ